MRGAMWWIDRWRQSDTFARMTAEEQGLYRNLCDEVVLRDGGVIPDDQRILAKASGDHEAWARSGASVLKSMKKVRGGWTNVTALEVKNESERRARKQRNYRNRLGNAAGNASGNDADNEVRPPYQDQEKDREKEQEPEPDPIESPGRSVTPGRDGTPLKPINGFDHERPPITAVTLGIRTMPGAGRYCQGHLARALVGLTRHICEQTGREPEKEATALLRELSETPDGSRIETLDIRRVPEPWCKVTFERALKFAKEEYGFDLEKELS